MDQLATLEYAVNELRRVIAAVDDSEMGTLTCCQPWTVRQLASHALNVQLWWVGLVTGRETVSLEDTMGGVPHEGDLVSIADDAVTGALATWSADGVLQAMLSTPLGETPGTTIVNFPTIDALAHSWDISTALGRPVEFAPEAIAAISRVVQDACTDATRSIGLFAPATQPPTDATDTERLMAATGRAVNR